VTCVRVRFRVSVRVRARARARVGIWVRAGLGLGLGIRVGVGRGRGRGRVKIALRRDPAALVSALEEVHQLLDPLAQHGAQARARGPHVTRPVPSSGLIAGVEEP